MNIGRLGYIGRLGKPSMLPISLAQRWSTYWKARGVVPGASATLITSELNIALTNYRNVSFPTVGTYDINGTIWVPSNTTLTFGVGITLKKNISGGDFCHVFANKGGQSLSPDQNINIIGSGLVIDINSSNQIVGGINGTRAQIQFYSVKGGNINGISSNNPIFTNQFFIALVDCENIIIQNLDITSDKDGIDIIGKNKNILIKNSTIKTRDDSIFIGIGYGQATPVLGDNENITIDNVIFISNGAPGGFCVRIWSGSWGNWTNGRTYHWNESCINAGNIYTMVSTTDMVAANVPTHTSGEHVAADGITWRFIESASIFGSNVNGVTIKNCSVPSDRRFIDLGAPYITPGTEASGIIDNVICDNNTFASNYARYVLNHSGQCGVFEFKNTNIVFGALIGTASLFYGNAYPSAAAAFRELKVTDCNFSLLTGPGTLMEFYGGMVYGFTKATFTRVNIDINTGYLFSLQADLISELDFVNCTFKNIDRLTDLGSGYLCDLSINMTNCEFIAPVRYIIANLRVNNHIHFVSTGTKYVDPIGNLFFNNQASATVSINLSSSTGTVTNSKVRNDTNVTVIACDIPYV